jgi:LysM repeat protein
MGRVRRASWRQYLPYLLLNVGVSAVTALLVFQVLGRPRGPAQATITPTLDVAARVASAVPTATLTLAPSATPYTYQVQPGDTMYGIAQRLGIPLDDLMAENGLTDPTNLDVGQVLKLPYVEGLEARLAEETGTLQPEPVEGAATAQPAEAPNVEILGVNGAGNLDAEVVRILNTGGVAHMAGWSLDDGGEHVYYFPVFSLHNGAVSVHTKGGSDTVIDLYWGLDRAVWLPGTLVTLRDSTGAVQDTFQIP